MTKDNIPYNVAKWQPSDQKAYNEWLNKVLKEAQAEENKNLLPPVQALKELIENDHYIWNLTQLMFDEIPVNRVDNPADYPQVHDYNQMLLMLNRIIQRAPEYNHSSFVGTPMAALFNYPMATRAGFAFFMNDKVNAKLRDILNYWGKYLKSEASTYVLNTSSHGWLCDEARELMAKKAYGNDFEKVFHCRSNKLEDHLGFTSWDDYFTREFNPGVRPVENPNDPDSIACACESAPLKIAHNLPLRDKFWMKGQPYSLLDLLQNDPWADQFKGGTLYQAFLSVFSFHRWNSPVDGTIVKAYNLPGSYYAENLYEGFTSATPDDTQATASQGFLTSTATRAVIFIKSDNPKIGLMCFVAVGMSEVSSDEITVKVGQHVKKGDQLGLFHFGGSTHVLLFRPETQLEFNLHGQTPGLGSEDIKVNSEIAHVK